MMPRISSLVLTLFLICIFSCQKKEETNATKAVLYPNQDAPLALLMREMFLDMEEIKLSVENKEALKSYLEKHKDILSAIPTNPKVKTEQFQLMGNAYLESLTTLENSSEDLLIDNYQAVVNTCLGCHQQYCPGPIQKINKLIKE
ncbi:hypothetical protein [Aquiflexum balticum]|nr:hypothetical protein [Aquiflexum balticum]